MKVTIDGKDYNLNTEKAIRDGYLTPSARPITIADIEVGDVFMYIDTPNRAIYIRTDVGFDGFTRLVGGGEAGN